MPFNITPLKKTDEIFFEREADGRLSIAINVNITDTSTQSAELNYEKVLVTADSDCFFNVGTNPTVTTTTGKKLSATTELVMEIIKGDKIAVIQA